MLSGQPYLGGREGHKRRQREEPPHSEAPEGPPGGENPSPEPSKQTLLDEEWGEGRLKGRFL